MSLFDSVVQETREKFNLGDKAEILLSVLLATITNKSGGGLTGFLERFNRAGLSGISSSWVDSGANTHISNEQLESALGNSTIQSIADQTGIDNQTASSAIAFMLPHIVDNLTPDGIVPLDDDLLSRTGAARTSSLNAGEAFDRFGTAATDDVDASGTVGNLANTTIGSVASYDDTNDDSPLKWLLPLIILALLVILGFSFCSKSESPKTTAVKKIIMKTRNV